MQLHFKPEVCIVLFIAYTGRVDSGKRNVTVWRTVRLSVCPVDILTVTHQGAAL